MSGVEIQPLLSGNNLGSEASSSGRTNQTQSPSQPKIDTVWKACAYGDFDTLRTLLGQDASLVHKGDDQVHLVS